MSEICKVKYVAENTYKIRNICLPEPYNGWVDLTPYLKDDAEATFDDETSEQTKVSSPIKETYIVGFGASDKFSITLKAGTYISEYFKVISKLKRMGNVNILNSFQMITIDPMDTTLDPLCSMGLDTQVLEAITENQYQVEFTMYKNGKAVTKRNEDYIPNTESPYEVDVNLDVVQTLNSYAYTWDTTATSVSFEDVQLEIVEKSTGTIVRTNWVEDGTLGTYTWDLIEPLLAVPHKFRMLCPEVGNPTNYILVGEKEMTPTVARVGAKPVTEEENKK